MTDYLLVHGAGQGAWSWGAVWGYLTAPVEHPPRLHVPRRANRVYPLDLPGHGADARGDTAEVRLEECVHAITRAVERENLKDLVLVGHGFAGGLVLQAVNQIPQPPKRLVLIAGIVPISQRSMLSALPRFTRGGFRLMSVLSRLSRQELRLPPSAIGRLLWQWHGTDGSGSGPGVFWRSTDQGPDGEAVPGGRSITLSGNLRRLDQRQVGAARFPRTHGSENSRCGGRPGRFVPPGDSV